MKKFTIKFLSLLLAIAMILPMAAPLAAGITAGAPNNANTGTTTFLNSINGYDSLNYEEGTNEYALLDNNYLSLYVNRKNGGFTVIPSDHTFDASKGQSYAVFRIGDYFYKFGVDRYTASGTHSDAADVTSIDVVANAQGNPVVVTSWTCAGNMFFQKQTIVKETSMKSSYAVYTEYSLVKGASEVSVTPYLMLDVSFGEGQNDSDISRFVFTKTGRYLTTQIANPKALDNTPVEGDENDLLDFDLVSSRLAPYNEYFPLQYEDVTPPTKIVMDHYSVEKYDEALQSRVLDTANSRYYDDNFDLADPVSSSEDWMKDGVMQVFYPQATVAAKTETDPLGTASEVYSFVYGYSLLPDARFGRESFYAPEIIYDTPTDANKINLTGFGHLPWYGGYTFGYEWETSMQTGKRTGISSIYSQYYLKASDSDMAEITTDLGIAPLTADGYVTTETFNFGVQTKQINHVMFGSVGNYFSSGVQDAYDNDGRYIHTHMYIPNAYEQAVDPMYNQDKYKLHVVTAELYEITVVSDDAGRTLVPVAFSSCSCDESQKAGGDHSKGHIYEIPAETLLDGKYYAPVGSTVYFAYMQSDDVSAGNGVRSVTAANASVTENFLYPGSDVRKEQYFSFTMPAADVTLNVDFEGTADSMAYRVVNNSTLITCDTGTATEGDRVNLLVDYKDLYDALEITMPENAMSMNEILDGRKNDFIIKVSTLSGKNVAIISNEVKYGFGLSSPLHVFGGGAYVYQFGGRTKLVTHFTMPDEGVILSVQVFERQEYSITAVGNNMVSIQVTSRGNEKATKAEVDDILYVNIKRQKDADGKIIDWPDFLKTKILINGIEAVTMGEPVVYAEREEMQFAFRMPAANASITLKMKENYRYTVYADVSYDIVSSSDGKAFEEFTAPFYISNPPVAKDLPVGAVRNFTIIPSMYASGSLTGVKINGTETTREQLIANGEASPQVFPCLVVGAGRYADHVYDYYFEVEADGNNELKIEVVAEYKPPVEVKMAYPDAQYYNLITGFTVVGDFVSSELTDDAARKAFF